MTRECKLQLIKCLFVTLIVVGAVVLFQQWLFYEVERPEMPFDIRYDLDYRWLDVAGEYHGALHVYWSGHREAWVFVRDGVECLAINPIVASQILELFDVNDGQRQWLESVAGR